MSQTHPIMGESSGKRRKLYVDLPPVESKICLIHGPRYSSNEFNVMGDFGAKYDRSKPTKDRGDHTVLRSNSTGSRKIITLLITWWMKYY